MPAAALRFSVGSAKAASTAQPGSDNISARSEPPIARLAARPAPSTTSGTDRWRYDSCRRHRHSVHSANGQAGHRNHNHWRPMTAASMLPEDATRQRQVPRAQATAAAVAMPASTQAANPRTCGRREPKQTAAPAAPTVIAMAGAPLPASRLSAASTATRGRQR